MSKSNNEHKAIVRDFLNAHRKAVFAIIDDGGLPATSLLLYAIDDDLNVYFGTRRVFKKYNDILVQPVVSLSVIEEKLDPLKVVDIRGTATEIPASLLSETHAFFKTKNPAKYYVEGAEDFTMFKLTPHFMRWLDASTGELEMIDIEF